MAVSAYIIYRIRDHTNRRFGLVIMAFTFLKGILCMLNFIINCFPRTCELCKDNKQIPNVSLMTLLTFLGFLTSLQLWLFAINYITVVSNGGKIFESIVDLRFIKNFVAGIYITIVITSLIAAKWILASRDKSNYD